MLTALDISSKYRLVLCRGVLVYFVPRSCDIRTRQVNCSALAAFDHIYFSWGLGLYTCFVVGKFAG